MSEEKIPTAEEFVKMLTNSGGGRNIYSKQEVAHVAKEFAKLHVQAALKAASEFADGDDIEENRDQILSAYPLENIK